jgi:hypothetical protein
MACLGGNLNIVQQLIEQVKNKIYANNINANINLILGLYRH